MDREIFIGFDPRERRAYDACVRSILTHAKEPIAIRPISRQTLGARYDRPTETRDGKLWDVISAAPMSTEFSLARFWVPTVSFARVALFVDCDFLFRADPAELVDLFDQRYAVQVVQHDHQPAEAVKMDRQQQTRYARKNWSSCALWNLRHAAAKRCSMPDLTSRQGLWLHGFGWLKDQEIGHVPETWNWLDGYSDPLIEPKAVHFTRGTPDMIRDCHSVYAADWWAHSGAHSAPHFPVHSTARAAA